MLSAFFIDRPRFAVVIALILILGGGIALTRIPVAQFPNIVPPQVQVTVNYPGASARVVEQTVAEPIEETGERPGLPLGRRPLGRDRPRCAKPREVRDHDASPS